MAVKRCKSSGAVQCSTVQCSDLGGVGGRVSCGSVGRARDRHSIVCHFHLVWPHLPGNELQLAGLWTEPGLHLNDAHRE